MPDAFERVRQDVQKEMADELQRLQGQLFEAVSIAAIPVGETDWPVVNAQQAVVGNGHAMRVATEIIKNLRRSSKGGLRVDHPVFAPQSAEERRESLSGL